jgi:hypothetical protein
LALGGAVYGCLLVGVASGFLGVWPLFFAFPVFTVFLALSALLSAVGTALLARSWRGQFSTLAVMILSALLTFLLFSAMPLYVFLFAPGRAGGLLFN